LHDSSDPAARQVVLHAFSEAGLGTTPPIWLDELARQLPTADSSLQSAMVTTARALPLPKTGHAALTGALTDVGRRRETAPATRIEALLAAGALGAVSPDLFDDLVGLTRPAQPLDVRSGAATILAKATLTADQRSALAAKLKDVGPLELPKLLPAFERAPVTETLGMELVDALKVSTARRALRADLLKPVFAKYPPAVQAAGRDLLAQLDTSAGEQAAHLDKLMSELPKGDVRRGHEVFLKKEVACVTCHTLGYQGGRLGPDLTHIGKTRNERDLLEAIVYPSVSFVRGYEAVIIDLRDGDTVAGIVQTESREDLVIATGADQTRRIPRTDIAEVRPGTLSLMPQGFEELLGRQNLADLIAFLKAQN
jgi:putative heme-binding domain-containing protein